MDRLITLTKDRFEKAKTPKGGYNAKQLRALGVGYPPKKGWKKKLIGQQIKLKQFLMFVVASKNTKYIEEIDAALPQLTPPVAGIKKLVLATPIAKPKSSLSKKEKKRQKNQEQREHRDAERVQRIIDFGVHRAAQLITDEHETRLHPTTKVFLERLMAQDEAKAGFDDVKKVYGLLKRHGVTLSYTSGGDVVNKSFIGINKIRADQLLYVIRAKGTDYCKIGVSKDPKARKRELQTSNPHPLTISLVFETDKNAVKLEKSLHKHFKKRRKQGEWFEGVENDELIKAVGDRAILANAY